MTIKLSPPVVSHATLQFEVDQRLVDFVIDENHRERFEKFMLKIPGVVQVTCHKFTGPYVWISFANPHGRFILNHELAFDRLVKFQKDFIDVE